MKIKNIKIGYSTDQYSTEDNFTIELTPELVEAIKDRIQAFARFREGFMGDNDKLAFMPGHDAASTELGQLVCVYIAATPFENDPENEGFMLEISDSDDYTYESEWLPFEALYKERFLLQYENGDDGEIFQWQDGLDDGVFDPEDFTAIYANSVEDAIEIFKSTPKPKTV